MKQDIIVVEGTVSEELGNSQFRVTIDNGHTILCTISGKIRKNYIKIMTGDKVRVEMSPYDLNRGRISVRLPSSNSQEWSGSVSSGKKTKKK